MLPQPNAFQQCDLHCLLFQPREIAAKLGVATTCIGMAPAAHAVGAMMGQWFRTNVSTNSCPTIWFPPENRNPAEVYGRGNWRANRLLEPGRDHWPGRWNRVERRRRMRRDSGSLIAGIHEWRCTNIAWKREEILRLNSRFGTSVIACWFCASVIASWKHQMLFVVIRINRIHRGLD